MTSLNAGVVGIRLVIALFIQRLIASMLGASGVAIIGQLQSLTQLMTSVTSFGIFNGIVKYVAEYKEDKEQLQKLFSTTFVFTSIVSVLSSICFLIFSAQISEYLFDSADFAYLIKIMAVVIPFISTQRIFNGVINGLSEYKKFAKIELITYLFSSALVVVFLFQFHLNGVLIAIAITPIIKLLVLLYIFRSDFAYLIKIMAVVIPFISTQRIFNGVINGLSEYKKFAKIELITYLFSSALVVVFLFQFHLNGVLIAIAITPIIKLLVLLYIFFKILNEYVQFKKLKFKLF